MAKYVDVDKVEKNVEYTYAYIANDPDEAVRVVDLRKTLENTPAADVEPVKHGHWVWKRRTVGGSRRYTGVDDMGEERTVTVDERHETVVNYCSECGKRGDDTFLRYCPHCGAKMDGKDDDKN